MKCPNCGEILSERAQFCMMCGTKIEQKLRCKKCGEELDKKARFCMICGTPVEETAPVPEETAEPAAPVTNNTFNVFSWADIVSELEADDDEYDEESDEELYDDIEEEAEEDFDEYDVEPEDDDYLFEENTTENISENKSAPETVVLDAAGKYEYEERGDLVNVVIADGITEIGDLMFANCVNLESVKIPDSVTRIGAYVFTGCNKLKTVELPENLTEICEDAFADCALKDMELPENVTKFPSDPFLFTRVITDEEPVPSPETVTLHSAAAYRYQERNDLVNVVIAEGVQKIGESAFCFCENLESVTLPDSLTAIGSSAFAGCENLKTINIPAGLVDFSIDAFSGCTALSRSDTASPFKDGSAVLNSAGAFEYLLRGDLVNVVIADGVTKICKGAFAHCNRLRSVTIPKSVVEIEDDAFAYCVNLVTVNIPDSVNKIGDRAFSYCESLKSITLPDSASNLGCCIFEGCENLEEAVLPSTISKLPHGIFARCRALKRLQIPRGVTSIGGSAFLSCESLKTITLPAGVSDIGDAFCGSGIESITLPENLTCIQNYAFQSCGSLKSISLPKGVTYIGQQAFEECVSLERVTLQYGMTEICQMAFYGCHSLKSINIPESVNEIGHGAFEGCENLESIELPYGVTKIDGYTFQDCKKIKSVTIPDSVRIIGNNAFSRCEGLKSAALSEGIVEIGEYAFRDCVNLKNIVLPDSLCKLSDNAFSGCGCAENLIIPGGANVFHTDYYKNYNNDDNFFNTLLGNEPVSNTSYTFRLKSVGSYEYRSRWELENAVIADGVTEIGASAFENCKNLKSITIPDSVTTIGDNAFKDCMQLFRPLSELNIDESGNSVLDYEKSENRANISVQTYKSKGETKYRYVYTNGGMEHKFSLSGNYTDNMPNFLYNNCLFFEVCDTFYVHTGGAAQPRFLGETGKLLELHTRGSDVIAIGSKGVVKCNTSKKQAVMIKLAEDDTRFLRGAYSDGVISVGSGDPDKVCIINKNNQAEIKKGFVLLKHLCDNFKHNRKVFDLREAEFRYSFCHGSGVFAADAIIKIYRSYYQTEIFEVNIRTANGRAYASENFAEGFWLSEKLPVSKLSQSGIPELIKEHIAYMTDRKLKNGKARRFLVPQDSSVVGEVSFFNNENAYYFFGWKKSYNSNSNIYNLYDYSNKSSFSGKDVTFRGLFKITDGKLYEYLQDDLETGKLTAFERSTLKSIEFNPTSVLQEPRFAPLFDRLSLLRKHKLALENDDNYEGAVVTPGNLLFTLATADDAAVFVAERSVFRPDSGITVYRWLGGELSYCDYSSFDVSQDPFSDINFYSPVPAPQLIRQIDIPAPVLNGEFQSFGQSTVDNTLKAQGFTVTKKDGADLSVSFKETHVTTESNGTYYHDATPFTSRPMAKYSLSYTGGGSTVNVNKYADMSAYTLDSRYGFIYAKDNKVYYKVGNAEKVISFEQGSKYKEIVSLLVVGNYLLVTQIEWTCIRMNQEHDMPWGGYTTDDYGACPVTYIYGFSEGKVIKTQRAVGVYPEYVRQGSDRMLKILYFKGDKWENSYQATSVILSNVFLKSSDIVTENIKYRYS